MTRLVVESFSKDLFEDREVYHVMLEALLYHLPAHPLKSLGVRDKANCSTRRPYLKPHWSIHNSSRSGKE